MITVAGQARDMGMELSVIGTADTQKLLAGFEETKAIRYFSSVQEARAAGI